MGKKKKKKGANKEAPKKHEVPTGFGKQVFALVLILLAVLLILAAVGGEGTVLRSIFNGGVGLVGYYPMWLFAFLLITSSVLIFKEADHKLPISTWIMMTILLVCLAALFGMPTIGQEKDLTGGIVGDAMAQMMVGWVGTWGSVIVYTILSFVLVLFLFAKTPMDVFKWIGARLTPKNKSEDAKNARVIAKMEEKGDDGEFKVKAGVQLVDGKEKKFGKTPEMAPARAPEREKSFTVVDDPNWKLPNESLLEEQKGAANPGNMRENSLVIKDTLAQFDIDVTTNGANVGPRVTQYTITPANGVKLARIQNMDKELARSLAADKIRIEAPIPGTTLVGVEIPNIQQADVGLREMVDSKAWKEAKGKLLFAVGKDIAGEPVVADLAKMPHLLIAGTTGSGKSVMMNTLLLSLLYKNTPADMRLIIIDPKQVEMASYSDIKHLITPIITDVTGAMSALEWTVKEMEQRYKDMAAERVKNIAEYNEKVLAGEIKVTVKDENGNEQRHDGAKLPYIVMVVDEMADLMMAAGKDLEARIVRVAQKGRAAGIHLVLATQRPEVKVVTGLIKANIPGRIAFAVGSQIDSRVMLDMNGAEKLLGRGDMLFLTTEMMGKPQRLQGAFATEKRPGNKGDIERVTDFLREQGAPDYNPDVATQHVSIKGFSSPGSGEFEGIAGFDPRDPLVRKAVEIALSTGKYGASQLQNMFNVGHGKVTRIALGLEQMGVVGPAQGTKPRDILIGSIEEFDELVENWG